MQKGAFVRILFSFFAFLFFVQGAWADSIQIDVDKTFELRRGGFTINHSFLLSSRSSNLTGSIAKDCRLNLIGKSKGELEMQLYLGNSRYLDETSTNIGATQHLRLKFKTFEQCKSLIALIEAANNADDNGFRLTIDSHRVVFKGALDQRELPLNDLIVKNEKAKY
jgi:hypothetical protein